MSEIISTEGSPIMMAPKHNNDDEPEVHVLTQQEINEQIISHFNPLSNQLEDLTRLIQGMTTAQHPTPAVFLEQPGFSLTISYRIVALSFTASLHSTFFEYAFSRDCFMTSKK